MNFQNFTTFRTILIALVLTITSNQLFAQNTNGIFFQAVARDNFSNPAKDRKIYVQSSIIQTTPTGIKVLTEEHQTNTDASGVFSINVGNGTRVGGTATSLANIDWSKGPFYLNLKLAITPIGGNSNWDYTKEWVDIGTTNFGAVPYALYSANSAKVDDKLNITDTSKMLAIYAKALTVQSLAKDVDNKLSSKDTLAMLAPYAKAAFVLDSAYINTQLKSKVTLADSTLIYVTPTMLKSKTFDTTSLSNRINLKANASDVASDLALKLNKADTILLFQKADTITLSNRIDQKLSKTDNAISATQLATARKINGVAFDGSADITVTADAGTLTGTTLASNVVSSSLTSVGTIATGVWSGTTVAVAKGGTGTTNGSITGTSALTFAAGGSNENISIKPSGTGSVIVGAGTITPTSSAALDVNSTSQGFLPPRLTTTQRDAITSPVEGLTIWNKTNKQLEVYDGSYWVNMIGKLVSTLNIGDSYGGGKVAYIFTSSDPGYIAGQTHGLIAANADQTTDLGVKWFPYTFYGATGTYLGLGLPNTASIIATAVLQGSTDITTFAAGLASSYRGGGYIDWYLPSKDELNKLYNNRVAIGGFATSGSIATYWSSSQKGTLSYTDFTSFKTGVASAYQQFFFAYNGYSEGTQNDLGISNLRRVRAVRTF